MARTARKNLIGNLFIHNMVQGINKEYIFEHAEDKQKYIEFMLKWYKKLPIEIIAYCIMDNHVHLLMYTQNVEYISKFMKEVNAQYAMYYNKKYERVGYLFRNRFNSKVILTYNHMLNCIKYIHMNPVKAGKVEKESEYEFSSYLDYINKTKFVNSKLLMLLFQSEENYLENFLSIKYQSMNLENYNVNLKDVLEEFLCYEKISKEKMKKSSIYIKKFICYLIENEYRFTKVEIAKLLEISKSKLYRELRNI